MRPFDLTDPESAAPAASPARALPRSPSAPLPGLTARQTEVHRAMLTFQEEHGQPPTQAELSRLLGMRSAQGVKAYLAVLEAGGFVVSTGKHGHRSKLAVWPVASEPPIG